MSDLLGLMNYIPSTSYAEDSPAKTYRSHPVHTPESRAGDLGYFGSYSVSFARWDRASSCWRTLQISVAGERMKYAGLWPASGMISDLAAYPQPSWARLTSETGGFSLPGEPLTDDHCGSGADAARASCATDTACTPTTATVQQSKTLAGSTRIPRAVWPTPIASMHRSGKVSEATARKNSRPLQEVVEMYRTGKEGRLNPAWVEALQGFPLGWTALTNGPPHQDHSTPESRPEPDHDNPTT
jgi:hypothetical protein